MKAKKQPGTSLQDIFQSELDDNSFPTSPSPNIKTNNVAYMIINRDDVCTAYIDLIWIFSCQSIGGNQYLLVAYHYDGNYIVAQPLKNRGKGSIIAGWSVLHKCFT